MPNIQTEEILRRVTDTVSSVARKAPGLAIDKEEISALFTPDIDIRNPSTYKQKVSDFIMTKVDEYLTKIGLARDTSESVKRRVGSSFTEEFAHIEQTLQQELLNESGVQKDARAKHTTHGEVKAGSHQIARAVMRNPKPEMREELNNIHRMLNNQFSRMSDAGINWLLEGAPAARGGFKDAASFRKFLQTPPENLSSSRLITAIDSISTAIGYRSIGVGWAKPPHHPPPEHPAREMYTKLQSTFASRIVPFIADSYNTRFYDGRSHDEAGADNDIEASPDDVSEASDVEYQEESLPQQRLGGQRYRDAIDPGSGMKSWPAAAAHGNVPIRAHVSGSAPIVLSVINSLYEDHENPWFRNSDNVRSFAGAVLIPTYERGDFHSTAETAAALEYFLAVKNKEPVDIKSPQECLKIGLDAMASATEGDLKLAIEQKSKELLSKTQAVSYMGKIDDNNILGILENCKNTVLLQNILTSQLPTQTNEKLMQWLGHSKDKTVLTMITQQMISNINRSTKTPNEKMKDLCDLYQKIQHHDGLRAERGFFSIFGATGNTKSFQQVAKEVKDAALNLLAHTAPGTFNGEELDKVKGVLNSTRGRMPTFSTTSSHSPHLNAHMERFKELKQEYAAMRQSTAVASKEKVAEDDETEEQTMQFK